MKKQILILGLFVLAVFASFTKSYGQAALAPSPGVAYDYAVTISGAAGATAPLFTFYVTKNNDLIAGSAVPEIPGADFTVTGGATYNTAANVNHISLTWTVASATTLTPFFLVAKYTETLNGCTTQNTKVWQIIPVNSFILAIVPSTATGVTLIPTDAHQCVADIVSAIMTPDMTAPLNPTVAYTYGKNILYFKATASGMLGKWRPDLQLTSGIPGALGQIYESAQWTEDMTGAGGWKTFTGAAGATPSTTAAAFPSADIDLATITDAVAGTPILIRIVIDNKNFETLADQVITAGIDGYLPSAFTQSDVKSSADLTPEVAFGKFASSSILKRPTETGTTVTFVTKAP